MMARTVRSVGSISVLASPGVQRRHFEVLVRVMNQQELLDFKVE